MSIKYPIIAITGSSGSGSYKVGNVFSHIAWRQKIKPLIVDGSAFHRYDRDAMAEAVQAAKNEGEHLSHFSPDGNILGDLEEFLRQFSQTGRGRYREYLHTQNQAENAGGTVGSFSEWKDVEEGTDLLVYQGLHGAYRSGDLDIAALADFTIGVAPIVNLEWIQKIHNDIIHRGYSLEEVKDTIKNRLHDYVHHITPQFSNTDINFQRVPLVDTSNPFISRDVPSCDESIVVIRFRYPDSVDFPHLLKMVEGSFMTRRNTIVVPGGKMEYTMELLVNPLVQTMMERRSEALASG